MSERKCYFCSTAITACMGFGLVRDLNALWAGKKIDSPRELCGKCMVKLHAVLSPEDFGENPPPEAESSAEIKTDGNA